MGKLSRIQKLVLELERLGCIIEISHPNRDWAVVAIYRKVAITVFLSNLAQVEAFLNAIRLGIKIGRDL